MAARQAQGMRSARAGAHPAHKFSLLLRGAVQEADIVARQYHAKAQSQLTRKQFFSVDATESSNLAGLFTRTQHVVERGSNARMVQLAWKPHLNAQVVGAN